MSEQIVGRDPIAKTMVETFDAHYPDLSDAELAQRIIDAGAKMGGDLSDVITPEIVAQWRTAVTR